MHRGCGWRQAMCCVIRKRGPRLANRGHLRKAANCLIENFNTMKIPDQCRFLARIKRTFSESKLR